MIGCNFLRWWCSLRLLGFLSIMITFFSDLRTLFLILRFLTFKNTFYFSWSLFGGFLRSCSLFRFLITSNFPFFRSTFFTFDRRHFFKITITFQFFLGYFSKIKISLSLFRLLLVDTLFKKPLLLYIPSYIPKINHPHPLTL